ncbi:hypothetical protein B0H17DRAFT_1042897 [Mycena rosella]|uniref:Uncharacterized protein n=1 Tax=Mycena rosella TaxID=1033263 RepID=A0AAD7GQY9_MYCRO|nr:hypothetical protein B0H17DRAFT_1042897 [Mycena rosella]
MKCHSHLENPEHNYVVSSTRQPLKHSAINILHATRYRTASLKVPRPMQGRIDAFDFTVQLSELPADDTAWLFAKDRLLAIIGQLSNNVVMVRKPGGESLSMTRIGTLGERYVVEWCLQAAPGNPDVGMWSWYRYQDGGYRVYNYTTLGSGPPTLVAWKEPSDWHWNFHEHVVMNPYKAEAAMILIMIGIVICSDMGRGLTNY